MNGDVHSINEEEINQKLLEFEKEFRRLCGRMNNLYLFLTDDMKKLNIIDKKYNNKIIEYELKYEAKSPILLPIEIANAIANTKNKKEKIELVNIEEAQNTNNYITKEVTEIITQLAIVGQDSNNIEKALKIVAIYIKKIELELESEGKNASLNQIYSKLQKTMEEDKENGYKWLYSTPIEENVVDYNIVSEGDYKYTGPILRFYTSIGPSAIAPLKKFFIEEGNIIEKDFTPEELDNYKKRLSEYNFITSRNADKYYPEKFKIEVKKKLTQIDYIWRKKKYYNEDSQNWEYSGKYAGLTSERGENIAINTYYFGTIEDEGRYLEENNLPDNDKGTSAGVKWEVKAFTHELGHVFDFAEKNYSASSDWNEIYKKIYNKTNSENLGIKMLDGSGDQRPDEWFARCVDQYIYYPNSKEANIPVTFRGEEMSLKDAMEIIMS